MRWLPKAAIPQIYDPNVECYQIQLLARLVPIRLSLKKERPNRWRLDRKRGQCRSLPHVDKGSGHRVAIEIHAALFLPARGFQGLFERARSSGRPKPRGDLGPTVQTTSSDQNELRTVKEGNFANRGNLRRKPLILRQRVDITNREHGNEIATERKWVAVASVEPLICTVGRRRATG